MRAVFFDNANRQDDEGAARFCESINFGKRYFSQFKHSAPQTLTWSTGVLEWWSVGFESQYSNIHYSITPVFPI
jgi:hypothetical protein